MTDPSAEPSAPAPFDGIRIVDLTHAGAGPFATMQLADLGATVIKIERLRHGDGSRYFGSRLDGFDASDYFLALNRSKASVALDFARPEGAELVRRLVADADVLIENFRPGVLARHGLDFATLADAHPRLVYCSISAFGPHGPWVANGGNDITIQGLSGLMAGTGSGEGGPIKIGSPLCDLTAGLYAAFGIASALLAREQVGRAQLVEVPMLDAAISLMASFVPSVAAGGPPPRPEGTGHAQIVPYQAFLCADERHLIVGAFSNHFWRALCEVIGRTDLLGVDAYRTNELRVKNRSALVSQLEAAFATRSRAEWLRLLEAAAVPCSPVLSVDEAIVSEQAVHNRVLQWLEAGDRKVGVTRQPIRGSAWRAVPATMPPALGEHTRPVLSEELGMSDADIDGLIASGVVESR
ncbi:CaiB/BaiF CoA-transferase family protein [Streptosporangium sp. NPDC005286]|uniref:CaiB/BaiF CoA transferase family protein n=1 Tax=Streptosporangium sp. NPDC005286 TaxID=3154463 RepID=UPI0033B4AB2E